jgi:type VI secretion system protein ImpI
MELMLEIISRQKFTATFPISHVFSEAGGFIGRSDECEWILPDKGKRISRKHAVISCDGNSFFIEDVSRNGIVTEPGKIFLNKGKQHKIDHGNSYTIGIYSIQARLLHKPDAYIQSGTGDGGLIPADNILSSDPLLAMEQQENFEAKRRLGYYDDLLGEAMPGKAAVPADHSSAAMDSLLRISGIPEQEDVYLPEDWNVEDEEMVPAHALFCEQTVKIPDISSEPRIPVPETDEFFRVLGFAAAPESPHERERMLRQAAELLLAAVDGMHHCLRNQAECKNDLRLPVTTMRLSGNNPFKFSPTPQVALEQLLQPARDGMLPPGKAMLSGFSDLHGHHMGLLAGARAAVRAVLDKISPKSVEARLDGNGPVHFSRKTRLWHMFQRMHQSLLDDHDGFSALFLHDFARAYDVQVRTLQPLPERSRFKGD